jgi:hypothetical protein
MRQKAKSTKKPKYLISTSKALVQGITLDHMSPNSFLLASTISSMMTHEPNPCVTNLLFKQLDFFSECNTGKSAGHAHIHSLYS